MNDSINTQAVNQNSNDIVTTNNNTTKSKEKTVKKATAKKTTKVVTAKIEVKAIPEVKAKKEVVKIAKPVIVIDDLKLPKEIIITKHSSCVSFVNANGNKWYLKGSTLEITTLPKELESRATKFTQDVIEKCHLGYVTAVIRDVKDTNDLQSIMKSFTNSVNATKLAKDLERQEAAKAKAEQKAIDKAAKIAAKKIETPVAKVA